MEPDTVTPIHLAGASTFVLILLSVTALVLVGFLVRSCARAIRAVGWREARTDVAFRILLFCFVVAGVGGGMIFVQWLGSRAFTHVTFGKDSIVLGFPWPAHEVTLPLVEIREVTYSELHKRSANDTGRIEISSSKGTFKSYWGTDQRAIRQLGERILRLKSAAGTSAPPIKSEVRSNTQ